MISGFGLIGDMTTGHDDCVSVIAHIPIPRGVIINGRFPLCKGDIISPSHPGGEDCNGHPVIVVLNCPNIIVGVQPISLVPGFTFCRDILVGPGSINVRPTVG